MLTARLPAHILSKDPRTECDARPSPPVEEEEEEEEEEEKATHTCLRRYLHTELGGQSDSVCLSNHSW
jgi:hypothetical protein